MTNPVRTILVKIGGSTLGAQDTSLADLVSLHRAGERLVVVHGGGEVVTQWMGKQGVHVQFVRGLRVTDAEGLEVATAVLAGLVNKQLVASLLALGGPAVGVSGVDGGLIQATIERPDLGFVGGNIQVDPGPIHALTAAGYIPVVAPIALHRSDGTEQSCHLLNVNADQVAGALAVALGASQLVFLTDVDGVLDSGGRLIRRIPRRQVEGLMGSGVIKGGMIPKLEACLDAAAHGISAHIVNGREPAALAECLRGAAIGTVLV